MKIERVNVGQAIVVRVSGQVDMITGSSVELQDHLSEVIKGKPKWIIVDLDGVPYMGSTGIAVLINCVRMVKKYSGRFSITGLKDHVKGVFDLLRVQDFFEIFDTEESALAAEKKTSDTDSH